MSMFGPRIYSQVEPNFTGLFRLIDDFDKYAGNGAPQQQPQNGRQHPHAGLLGRHVQTFTPKFDLRETEGDYELHGELPGIDKKDVHVEFTDPQTIVVRGRVERSYSAGTPPPATAGFLESSEKVADEAMSGAAAPAPEHRHQPTVEDDVDDDVASTTTAHSNTAGSPTPATTVAEVEKSSSKAVQQPRQPQQHKYWVSERSVGEFSRTFQFPGRVDSEQVSASLDNGILTVVVPKAKKHEGRRILIN
ncbi:small heat shock protein [Hypoxylon sp. FL1284]|nr:small heat shock protein [Hypoxylon sp. FL1284]